MASYIPQLARMNPEYWGVSVCTIDGQRFSIGDTTVPFTLQSCSKPLTYAIALESLGPQVVHQYVGQEPSGRNFNELVLDHNSKSSCFLNLIRYFISSLHITSFFNYLCHLSIILSPYREASQPDDKCRRYSHLLPAEKSHKTRDDFGREV